MIRYFLTNRASRPEAMIVVKTGKSCNISLYEQSCGLRGVTPSVKILDHLIEVEHTKPPKDGWFLLPDENMKEYGETGFNTVVPGMDYSYLSSLEIEVDVVLNLMGKSETVMISDLVEEPYSRAMHVIPDTHFLYEECVVAHNVIPAETLELLLDTNDPMSHKLMLMGITPKEVIHYTSRGSIDASMKHITDAFGTKINWTAIKNDEHHTRYITVL